MNYNIKANAQDRIDQINKEIAELQKEKTELSAIVKNGISFVSSELKYTLEYLIFRKEGESHSPHLKHSKTLTFEHLLRKYNISNEEWPGRINSSKFKRTYIIDFINFVADMQIRIGRTLTYNELFNAVDCFTDLVEYDKPKKRELKED